MGHQRSFDTERNMVREIIHEPFILRMASEKADASDLETAADMYDTLVHNRETCVGMAANMIGVRRRIIIFDDNGKIVTMFNPEIIKAEHPYETKEGCLSLLGGPRPVTRYKNIKVRWQNERFQDRIKNFSGYTAQIIQHEVDHINGVLI